GVVWCNPQVVDWARKLLAHDAPDHIDVYHPQGSITLSTPARPHARCTRACLSAASTSRPAICLRARHEARSLSLNHPSRSAFDLGSSVWAPVRFSGATTTWTSATRSLPRESLAPKATRTASG